MTFNQISCSPVIFPLFETLKIFSSVHIYLQGRIQNFVLGGTKVGKRSRDRLRTPAGPGHSPGRGSRGRNPPEAPGF